MKLAHLVNPVAVGPSSDLAVAQPLTFASMRAAQVCARGQVEVDLLAAIFPEDTAMLPDGFRATPVLERSLQDFGVFQDKRKLPLLADLLDRLAAASPAADYLIYSNVDIALMPHFYLAVAQVIGQGYDAFAVSRRTLPPGNYTPEQLPWLYAQLGERHGGGDCFVFPRAAYPNYELARVCIGLPPVARCLTLNMICHAGHFTHLRDLHLTFHIGDARAWSTADKQDSRDFNHQQFMLIYQRYAAAVETLADPYVQRYLKLAHPVKPTWQQRLRRRARQIQRRLRRLRP